MANTLNNFGLAEKILKTANKWCTADIDVKIDSAELEDIKSEYLRSGAEVFGIAGTYGEAIDTVTIPAGIYEIIYSPYAECTGINFYYRGALFNGFISDVGNIMSFNGSTPRNVIFYVGSSATNPGGNNVTWLDYLVYVPEDVTTTKDNAKAWYSQMHPYVGAGITPKCTWSFRLPYTVQADAAAIVLTSLGATYSSNTSVDNIGDCESWYLDCEQVFNEVPFNCGRHGIAIQLLRNLETSECYFGVHTTGGFVASHEGGWANGMNSKTEVGIEIYQYWGFLDKVYRQNSLEKYPEVLALLIALGAEPDPKFDCEICGKTCYVSDCEVLWRCEDCKDKTCNHTTGTGSSLVYSYKRLSDMSHRKTTYCKYCDYQSITTEGHSTDETGRCTCGWVSDPDKCTESHQDSQPCGACGYNYSTCPSCGYDWFYDSYCSHCGYSGGSGTETGGGDNSDSNYVRYYCIDPHGNGCSYEWSGPVGEQPTECPYCSYPLYADE